MSYAEAASIPIIYCTAQYCLKDVARLQSNETVLIHAAAGGVGQAAIMLAQARGAKVLATVGSHEKKDFLMSTYGVSADCIFYSRDTSFTQGVMEATNDKGVDVALNSLAGDQLRATWKCMAPFGRFVEIGKRDITSNMNLEMSRFERNVSFSAVDLTDLIHPRPQMLQNVFVHIMDKFKQNKIRPVAPIHEFATSEVEKAFRALGSGKLMGKLVIVPRADDMVMVSHADTSTVFLRRGIILSLPSSPCHEINTDISTRPLDPRKNQTFYAPMFLTSLRAALVASGVLYASGWRITVPKTSYWRREAVRPSQMRRN